VSGAVMAPPRPVLSTKLNAEGFAAISAARAGSRAMVRVKVPLWKKFDWSVNVATAVVPCIRVRLVTSPMPMVLAFTVAFAPLRLSETAARPLFDDGTNAELKIGPDADKALVHCA